ncbi:Hypothetical predicted protein [Paramuricea clavata]|uniref:Uncharacterized protein n=1 Tax=Paramuricea clavata TaxID=317549 RepID=A0A7D9E270_PARCT|nr:Hypothetical predicted protein [Paramuricea clavata]
MAALRAGEEQLLFLADEEGDVEDDEMLGFFLYLTEGLNPIPHRNYSRFKLENYSNEECVLNFHFTKADVIHLANALRLSDRFVCKNGTVASTLEGLCMLLRRLAYPNRLTDMVQMFGWSKSELSMVINSAVDFVFNQHHSLLNNLNVP